MLCVDTLCCILTLLYSESCCFSNIYLPYFGVNFVLFQFELGSAKNHTMSVSCCCTVISVLSHVSCDC